MPTAWFPHLSHSIISLAESSSWQQLPGWVSLEGLAEIFPFPPEDIWNTGGFIKPDSLHGKTVRILSWGAIESSTDENPADKFQLSLKWRYTVFFRKVISPFAKIWSQKQKYQSKITLYENYRKIVPLNLRPSISPHQVFKGQRISMNKENIYFSVALSPNLFSNCFGPFPASLNPS